MAKIDRCIRCKKAKGCSKSLFVCRLCEKKCCRHYCAYKDGKMATCQACLHRGKMTPDQALKLANIN